MSDNEFNLEIGFCPNPGQIFLGRNHDRWFFLIARLAHSLDKYGVRWQIRAVDCDADDETR